jgi:hypothetical protein
MNAQQNQSLFTIAGCLKERQSARLLPIRACDPDCTAPALHETAISHATGTYTKKR